MTTKPRPSKRPKHQDLEPLVLDIVVARKAQQFTQKQLAEMAGVARRTIVLLESGGDCTLSTLRRITIALGLEMHAYTPKHPTLDDVTRENEMLFANRRTSAKAHQGDVNA